MNRKLQRHRVLGPLLLITAIFMLILGETLLKSRLSPVVMLLYWVAPLFVTAGAIACALLDALRSFGQSRRERRELLDDTLHKIEAERVRRGRQPAGSPGNRIGPAPAPADAPLRQPASKLPPHGTP